MRKRTIKKGRFLGALRGFALMEALVSVLVLVITTAFFARFSGSLMGAYAKSRYYYMATTAARSYLEMVVRLGVPGWHVDGRYAVRLVAIEVDKPHVKQDGQLIIFAPPPIRFAHVVATGYSDKDMPVALLATVSKDVAVML